MHVVLPCVLTHAPDPVPLVDDLDREGFAKGGIEIGDCAALSLGNSLYVTNMAALERVRQHLRCW